MNDARREASRVIREAWDAKFTIVDPRRLLNLKRIAFGLCDRPGAFVECGVARGGCLALMAVLAGRDRIVWGFDSFEGLPELTSEDEGSGQNWVGVHLSGPEGERTVRTTFEVLGVPMDNVRVVRGWFEQSLPALVDEIGPIAILRLDADWYRATKYLLDTLYDSVVSGGAVLIDDYFCFEGCRRAVDEFRSSRGITQPLKISSPFTEAYWFK